MVAIQRIHFCQLVVDAAMGIRASLGRPPSCYWTAARYNCSLCSLHWIGQLSCTINACTDPTGNPVGLVSRGEYAIVRAELAMIVSRRPSGEKPSRGVPTADWVALRSLPSEICSCFITQRERTCPSDREPAQPEETLAGIRDRRERDRLAAAIEVCRRTATTCPRPVSSTVRAYTAPVQAREYCGNVCGCRGNDEPQWVVVPEARHPIGEVIAVFGTAVSRTVVPSGYSGAGGSIAMEPAR